MDDLISRTWLLAEYDKRHNGPPGGARKLIEEAPPALGTNLAEVGTDLISRQAAIDAINCDITITGRQNAELVAATMGAFVDRIKALPYAQPDIIRCKDCKYWDTTWQNDYAPNYHYCPMIDSTRRNDFYCADAERRTDG